MEDSSNIKIVCLGDSLTGWNLTSTDTKRWPFKTYPEFLEKKFADKFKSKVIANQGYEGEVSFYAKEITEKALKKYKNAEYFIVLFGANDIESSITLGKLSSEVAKQVSANLESCIEVITQNNKKPLMISIPHGFFEGWKEEYNLRVDECNVQFKEDCSRQKIPFIDICSKLKPEHFADGIHPNETGAEIIAQEIYKTLSSVLK